MRRRLFGFISAISTVLCVALIALWVRSCWYADLGWVRFCNHDSTIGHCLILEVGSGGFQFESYSLALLRDHFPEDRDYTHWESAPGDEAFGRWMHFTLMANVDILGFPEPWPAHFGKHPVFDPRLQFHRDSASDSDFANSSVGVIVPFWILTLQFVLLPAVAVFRFWQSRRRHICGVCCSCGYDLRATPDRCPECGTVPGAVT